MQEKTRDSRTPDKRTRSILVGALFIAAITVLFVVHVCRQKQRRVQPDDLLDHPLYSTYVFEKGANVIHFGYQPLWIFQNNIVEIMKRDAVLRKRLGKLGLKIKFHAFLKGEDVNFFALRNDLQGGTCGDMAMLAIASTLSVVVPAITDLGYDDIVTKGLKSIGELKGRRIGYPYGSDAHHALLVALDLYDMNEDEVKLVPMDVTEMVSAMKDERIDACALWEPTTSLLLSAVPNSVVIHRSRYLGFIYFRKDFAEAHPDAVCEILASEVRAIKWMLAKRSHLLESCNWVVTNAELFDVDLVNIGIEHLADIIDKTASLNFLPLIPSDVLLDSGHLHREYQFLRALGKIPSSNPWSKVRYMFTNHYLRHVLDNPVRYRINDLPLQGTNNG